MCQLLKLLEIIQAKKELLEAENRREELFKLREPIDQELEATYEKVQYLKTKRDELIHKNNPLNWTWLLDIDNDSTYKRRLACDELFKFNVFPHGTNEQTRQVKLHFSLIKNDLDSFQSTWAALESLLAFVKANQDGYKCIYFYSHKDRVIEVKISEERFLAWGKTFENIPDTLTYLQQYHWYKKEKNG